MMANLPYKVQLQKIDYLTKCIEKCMGGRPKCFRAGRFGLGQDTVRALVECDYEVDSSVTPFASWECQEEPFLSDWPVSPYYIGSENNGNTPVHKGQILEVPVTIGYNRWPFEKWHRLDVKIGKYPRWLPARSIMSKCGILRKISLCPETEGGNKMLHLRKILCDHGIRFLNMTFHSTSLVPGWGPS